MAYIKRHRITLNVTASAGASQAFFSDFIHGGGWVEQIHYGYGSASAISTAAHLVVTGEQSSVPILNTTLTGTAGTLWFPRAQAQDVSGGALGFTSGATPPPVPVKIAVAAERIKAEISSAGVASGGTRGVLDLYISGF